MTQSELDVYILDLCSSWTPERKEFLIKEAEKHLDLGSGESYFYQGVLCIMRIWAEKDIYSCTLEYLRDCRSFYHQLSDLEGNELAKGWSAGAEALLSRIMHLIKERNTNLLGDI